jgi:hypothetical protein
MPSGSTARALARPDTLVTELSEYELSTLRNGAFTLSRASATVWPRSVLSMPATDTPLVRSGLQAT